MVKAESKRLIEVPATYETVTEQYEAEAAGEKVEVLAPKMESMTEKMQLSPASTKWEKSKHRQVVCRLTRTTV